MASGRDINGVGIGIAALGLVLTWAGFNNVSPVEAFKELAMGKEPKPNPKSPFQPVAFTAGTGGGPGYQAIGSSDKSGGFASSGLVPSARAAGQKIISLFGNPYGIGGYRSGPGAQDHGTGHAIDVMISPGGKKPSAVQVARGYAIANYARANARSLSVKYVIYRQRIWNPSVSGAWRKMEDRGSITQNHFDHVHISFTSGTV